MVDEAKVFAASDLASIEARLAKVQIADGVQIVVATFALAPGESIISETEHRVNMWKLGDETSGRFVLIAWTPTAGARVRAERIAGLSTEEATRIAGDVINPRAGGGPAGAIVAGVNEALADVHSRIYSPRRYRFFAADAAPWLLGAGALLLFLWMARGFLRLVFADTGDGMIPQTSARDQEFERRKNRGEFSHLNKQQIEQKKHDEKANRSWLRKTLEGDD